MIPYKCDSIFFLSGRLPVISQKKKKKDMDHRSPMLGGIRAREISAEELSFVEVSGSREVCVSATDFF